MDRIVGRSFQPRSRFHAEKKLSGDLHQSRFSPRRRTGPVGSSTTSRPLTITNNQHARVPDARGRADRSAATPLPRNDNRYELVTARSRSARRRHSAGRISFLERPARLHGAAANKVSHGRVRAGLILWRVKTSASFNGRVKLGYRLSVSRSCRFDRIRSGAASGREGDQLANGLWFQSANVLSGLCINSTTSSFSRTFGIGGNSPERFLRELYRGRDTLSASGFLLENRAIAVKLTRLFGFIKT